MIRLLTALVMICLFATPVFGQEQVTEHTLKLSEGKASPPATIDDMAWLAGSWTGEGLGGISEEVWSTPRNGAMMGAYRMIKDGKIMFYEMLTLVEEEESLVLRLKHFNADLTGWEEKKETVDFRFVKKANGMIHFEGMAFHLEDDDTLIIYLAIEGKDETTHEEVFHLQRVSM